MEGKATLSCAGSICRRPPQTLAYGQFYGRFEQLHELSRFSVALITADERAMRGTIHTHDSTHAILVLTGQYVANASGVEQVVPRGSIIFVPAGTTHRDRFQTLNSRSLTVSVCTSLINQMKDYVRLPEQQSTFRTGEISFIANRLRAECRCWTNTSALTAEGLCLEWFAAVGKREEKAACTPPRWLRTARDMLNDRCRDSMTLCEIAAAVGVHPVHLTRSFRRFFNCTPGEYVRDRRVEIAASLLRSGRQSLAQVALESGFNDQSQLAKVFKRTHGITPSAFRRNAS